MIESITIEGVATFTNTAENLEGLSQFNFLFGSNGTGKTTVGRIIADESRFPTCKVTWKAGTKLQAMVYNHDFVERNFNQSAELKGVFTLGEKQIDTLTKIATAKRELDALTTKLETLTQGLQGVDGTGGKKGELSTFDTGLREKCWAKKQMHDAKLQGVFEGFRNSSERFKNKILQELASNTATILPLVDLEKKAESVFGITPTTETPVATPDTSKLLSHETNLILKKRVIGKENVDIAAIIMKLANSDWVREGRAFYDVNERVSILPTGDYRSIRSELERVF